MAKICPLTDEKVLYLDCLECDEKVCQKPSQKSFVQDICPITSKKAVYLDCLECKEKTCQKLSSKHENKSEKEKKR